MSVSSNFQRCCLIPMIRRGELHHFIIRPRFHATIEPGIGVEENVPFGQNCPFYDGH
jgi:hypothetical protein